VQARKYFIVLEKQNNKWTMQFGDYERRTAEIELEDMRYKAPRGSKGNYRLVPLDVDTQAAIDAKLAELNGLNP
jgi:hypothetical protein